MKRFLLLSIILFSTNTYGTVYFLHQDAEPLGNGLSWDTAWDNWGDTMAGALSPDDTVVVAGTLGNFVVDCVGTLEQHIVFIDSFRYHNGYDINYPPSTWSCTIGCSFGTGIALVDTNDYLEFIGFNIYSESDGNYPCVSMNGLFHSENLVVWFKQCRFYNASIDGGSAGAVFRGVFRISVDFSSSLFITHDYFLDVGNMYQDDSNVIFDNCTFFVAGNSATDLIFVMVADDLNERGYSVRNCILYNNYTDNDTYANSFQIADDYAGNIIDFDYNCIYSPKTSYVSCIDTVWNNTIEEHRIEVQKIDIDGATHSMFADPILQDTSGVNAVCTIKSGSPCWGTGVDIGYGGNIGWWQGRPPGQILSVIIQ